MSDHLLQLWTIAGNSRKEFEVVSRIPDVLEYTTRSQSRALDGAFVSDIFQLVADTSCGNISSTFVGSMDESRKVDNSNEDTGLHISLPSRSNGRHELFRNTSSGIMDIIEVQTDFSHVKYAEKNVSTVVGNEHRDDVDIMSCHSFLRLSVVHPLVHMIRDICAKAATALLVVPISAHRAELLDKSVSSTGTGFQLMHHLEYIRMLFLMGGEGSRHLLANAVSRVIAPHSDVEQSLLSPGAIFIPLQESYTTLLSEMILLRHRSTGTDGQSFTASASAIHRDRAAPLLGLSQKLYSLGQTMLSILLNSLPSHPRLPQNCTESFSTGGTVGVSVFFRADASTRSEERASESVGRSTAPSVAISPWPSLTLSNLICEHLTLELYYPFPLNRILSPALMSRLNNILIDLLDINILRWGIEATWKLDKISKASLENILMGYRSEEEVSALKRRLDMCRATLTWLLHCTKGYLFFVLSEVHDSEWEHFVRRVEFASQVSIEMQTQEVSMYVQRAEGLLSLYSYQMAKVISAGHAAISAYQLCLHSIRDICDCGISKPNSVDKEEGMLGSENTSTVIARCVVSIKRSGVECGALNIALTSFMDVIDALATSGLSERGSLKRKSEDNKKIRAGMAMVINAADKLLCADLESNRINRASYQKESARALAIHETRRLYAILGTRNVL